MNLYKKWQQKRLEKIKFVEPRVDNLFVSDIEYEDTQHEIAREVFWAAIAAVFVIVFFAAACAAIIAKYTAVAV